MANCRPNVAAAGGAVRTRWVNRLLLQVDRVCKVYAVEHQAESIKTKIEEQGLDWLLIPGMELGDLQKALGVTVAFAQLLRASAREDHGAQVAQGGGRACPVCSQEYGYVAALRRHIVLMHGGVKVEVKEEPNEEVEENLNVVDLTQSDPVNVKQGTLGVYCLSYC